MLMIRKRRTVGDVKHFQRTLISDRYASLGRTVQLGTVSLILCGQDKAQELRHILGIRFVGHGFSVDGVSYEW